MKKRIVVGIALTLGASSLAACVDETSTQVITTDDAGVTPVIVPLSDSGASDAGTDTSTPPSDAGPSDAGTDGSVPGDATTDGGLGSYAIFTGTDFAHGEVSLVGLSPLRLLGEVALPDQDSVPYVSGQDVFLLERTLGKVVVLDPSNPKNLVSTIDINDSPDAAASSSNPQAVVVASGTTAYVARYKSNVVKVVDLATGAATGSLDLSAFMAEGDPDSYVDVAAGAYDPTAKTAYFLLQRIDQTSYGPAPDYVGTCLPSRGAIVGIDTTTNMPVDLNGETEGQAIEILGANPASMKIDFTAGTALLADTGCYANIDDGGTTREGRGVELVDLTNGSSKWLYQTTDADRLNAVVWVDSTHAFVSKGDAWFAWNPTSPALGSALAGFPDAPVYDGAGHVIGLASAKTSAAEDAGTVWSVVSWDVTAGTVSSTPAVAPFSLVTPTSSFGVGSAIVLR